MLTHAPISRNLKSEPNFTQGGICMKGGIYRNKGRGAPFTVRFKGVYKRIWDYKEAERLLTGLRFQDDQGSFDPRDWAKDQPLGFQTLSEKWLKRNERKRSIGHMRNHVNHATNYLKREISARARGKVKEIGKSNRTLKQN